MTQQKWQEHVGVGSVPTKTEAGKPLVIGMGASPVVAHGRYWFRQKDGRVFSYTAGGAVGAGVGAARSEAIGLAAVNRRMRVHSGAPVSLRHPHVGAGQSSLPVDNGDGTYTCPDGAVITAGSVSDAVGACQQEASGGGGGGGAGLATLASNAISALNADINNYCADVAVPGSAVNSAVHAFKAAWNAANPGNQVPINTGNYEPSVAAALNSLSAGAPPGCSGGHGPGPSPGPGPGPSPSTPAASINLLILGGAAAAAVAIVGGAWWLKKHKGKRVVVHHRGLRRRRR